MPTAALYDIHGNLPALEAVLEELHRSEVDCIVIGGDVVVGPMSKEVLDLLEKIAIPVYFIKGDCEEAVLAQMAGDDLKKLPAQALISIQWTEKQLLPKQKQWMKDWPEVLQLTIVGIGKVLLCHATPRSREEIFTSQTSVKKLQPIFEHLDIDLIVCGHTHMQFDRMVGKTRVINAGSVGMPFGEPGAYWLLLGPVVEFRKTNYYFTQAAERVRKTNYPQAEHFATNNILHPPTERAMLELFSMSELK